MADPKPVWTIDQVVAQLTRWRAGWEPGSTIHFTFPNAVPAAEASDPLYEGFRTFDPVQREAVRHLFTHLSELVNLRFVESPDDGRHAPGEISFANYGPFVSRGTVTTVPKGDGSATITRGGVWIQPNLAGRYDAPDSHLPGGWNYQLLLHELGHVIGLPHPGNYGGGGSSYETHAPYQQDTQQYSVMSYFAAENTGASHRGQASATYGVHDIAALQKIYGANMATRAGDTVYGFNSNAGGVYDFSTSPARVLAIWDGGGVDTIDISGFPNGSTVRLEPGAFSNVGGYGANLSIAYGVIIENVVGGPALDWVFGNDAANTVQAGGGDDIVEGRNGADVLLGNQGADSLLGGAGEDRLFGGRDNDTVSGGEGGDFAQGDFGDDVVSGEAGADVLSGGHDQDRIDGGGDRDLLFGGDGDDTLDGGAGADFVAGDDGRDVITNAGGVDLIFGGAGDDTVTAGADGDALLGNLGADLVNGGSGGDSLWGGQGDDTLSGGGGDDQLSGDLGSDVLTGGAGRDRFVFSAADGSTDRIADFSAAEDLIDLSAIDADAGADGDQAFGFAPGFTGAAGQAVLTHDGGVTTLRLDVNGDGAADLVVLIAGLHGPEAGWVL